MLTARQDDTGAHAICGRTRCPGQLATLTSDLGFVWAHLAPGYVRGENGVYRLTRYAAERVRHGKDPKNRRAQGDRWHEPRQRYPLTPGPETAIQCPRCRDVSIIHHARLREPPQSTWSTPPTLEEMRQIQRAIGTVDDPAIRAEVLAALLH